MATYIVYHQVKEGVDCPDGVAAAWVAHKAHPDAHPIGCWYGAEEREDFEMPFAAGDSVIIVDFSFPESVIQQWLNQGIEITLIDHHKTAQKHLSSLLNASLEQQMSGFVGVFDMQECGATLAWKYFFSRSFPDKPMPHFLNHVRDRDLWDFLLPETEMVHEAMSHLRFGFKYHSDSRRFIFSLFDGLAALNADELHKFLGPIGEPLVRPRREKVAEIAERCIWGTVAGYAPIPFVVLASDGSEDRFVSDVCMLLYRKHPTALFSACLTSDGTWSLRSDKHGLSTDVGAIAASLGGGGHHNAAGFKPVEGADNGL